MESIRRVFLTSILVDVEFEAALSRSNFGSRGGPLYHWGGSLCGISSPKLVYKNSESFPKIEVRMS